MEIFEKARFWSKFLKISIFLEIYENSWFCSKFAQKSWFWSKFAKNRDFGRNIKQISILVEISEKFRFCSNSWKISILVEIFKKSQ